MKRLLLIILSLVTIQLNAQEKVGINTTTPETTLDVISTNDTNGAPTIQMATPPNQIGSPSSVATKQILDPLCTSAI